VEPLPPDEPGTPAHQPPPSSDYPVSFSVDYPDRDLDRLTTLFRFFVVIPIAIVLELVSNASVPAGGGYSYYYTAGGLLFMPVWS
jgi:hypothetical protein